MFKLFIRDRMPGWYRAHCVSQMEMLRARASEDTAIKCLLPWGKQRPGAEMAQSPCSKCITLASV